MVSSIPSVSATYARNVSSTRINALVYGGGLAAFGAGIHLLGEIRDRLTRGG